MPCEELLRGIPLPRLAPVRQKFDAERIGDIPAAVARALERAGTLDRIRPGMRVAVSGGSRGWRWPSPWAAGALPTSP